MICLYHKNCNDGAAAALAVWVKFGDEGNQYLPVNYCEDPPEEVYKYQDIIIVDFSYKRDVLIDLSCKVKSIILIDHHKTSREDLNDIRQELSCKNNVVFDMEKSGAVLAWEYFNPEKELPGLFKHIQDRDLWTLELPETQNIAKALKLYPDWREWNCLFDDDEFKEFIIEGKAINDFLELQTKSIIQPPSVWEHGGNEKVPILNIPGFMASDSLNQALEIYPESPYAVSYFCEKNKTTYSLRSRNGSDVDVSKKAERFGGGGHKHAAGFVINKSN